MRIILLVLSVLLFSSDSLSQNRAVSYIGVCSKSVAFEDVKGIFDGRRKIGIHYLVRTFNSKGCPVMERLIKDPRPFTLHVSLLNGPGLRNRRLQDFEYLYGYSIASAERAILNRDEKILAQVRAAAIEVKNLVNRRRSGELTLRVKSCLECDFNSAARKILNEQVKEILPQAELIDNPLNGRCIKGMLCERHSDATRGDVLDLDGTDYDTINQLDWTRAGAGATKQFIWKLCNNGFKKHDPWRYPEKRRNYCEGRDLKEFRFWIKDDSINVNGTPNPLDLKGCRKLLSPRDGEKSGFIWKLGDGKSIAVALLPLEDGRETNWRSVDVMKDGGVFDRGSPWARYSHDPEGKQRQVFHFTKHPSDYRDNVVLRVDGGARCVLIQKPQFRND